jgi:hypothetical protein
MIIAIARVLAKAFGRRRPAGSFDRFLHLPSAHPAGHLDFNQPSKGWSDEDLAALREEMTAGRVARIRRQAGI